MKNIYRIEIHSKFNSDHVFMMWIGKDLELVSVMWLAEPCTEEESLAVMQRINCEATCFKE